MESFSAVSACSVVKMRAAAFFLRVEVTKGEEVLPVLYDGNYVTLFL